MYVFAVLRLKLYRIGVVFEQMYTTPLALPQLYLK